MLSLSLDDNIDVNLASPHTCRRKTCQCTTSSEQGLVLLQMQYLRLNADFENFRRRAATEKDAVGTRTKAKVIEVGRWAR